MYVSYVFSIIKPLTYDPAILSCSNRERYCYVDVYAGNRCAIVVARGQHRHRQFDVRHAQLSTGEIFYEQCAENDIVFVGQLWYWYHISHPKASCCWYRPFYSRFTCNEW